MYKTEWQIVNIYNDVISNILSFTAIMGIGLHALHIGVIGATFINATKK